jgi:hypothetical protein
MKRIAWLTAICLCSATLLFAGDKGKLTDLTGVICNDKCVVQSGDKASCDPKCTETSGDFVCIDNNGTAHKVENPDMVKPMAGKKVKMKGTMNPDTGSIAVQNIVEYSGGG